MEKKYVKFIEATSAQLENAPLDDGAFYFTTDTHSLYRDTDTERVLLSGGSIDISLNNEVLSIG